MSRDREWVEDIHEAALRIESYLSPDLPAFLADGKTQDAVIRQFAIIGEATKRLSAAAPTITLPFHGASRPVFAIC